MKGLEGPLLGAVTQRWPPHEQESSLGHLTQSVVTQTLRQQASYYPFVDIPLVSW